MVMDWRGEQDLKACIAALRAQGSAATEEEYQTTVQQQALEQDPQRHMAELQAQIDTLDTELQEKLQAFQAAQEQAKNTSTSLTVAMHRSKEADEKVHDLTEQLSQHQCAVGNRLRMFGQHAALLVQAIGATATQFHRMPIGPVGSHQALKDSRTTGPFLSL
ncbi:hypothetical protein WJX72_008461 [[Myrmecia] bisecta]|uniref:Uncharacterized protein n=1 Tax=[Myrmecia] bisecta TaxID=41462 RepID=A0AAW1PYD6_9CHLO